MEPDTFAYGRTVVAVFQSGRFADGAAARIGFATSSDAGATWRSGFLPALTVYSAPGGAFDRASDPTIAYDAVHQTWLAATLAVRGSAPLLSALVVSRSTNGLDWSAPVTVAQPGIRFAHDKSWIVCDNGPRSRFRGRCYISYSDETAAELISTVRSGDGGLTWSVPTTSHDALGAGSGAQPVVLPHGTLVIPFLSGSRLRAIRSTDGGASFGRAASVAFVRTRFSTTLRTAPLPSVEVDGGGRIYAAWQDCRFRPRCPTRGAANDIVWSTSVDGSRWSAPRRVPIQRKASRVSDVIPGLAVDPATSGRRARLALTYYTLGPAGCSLRSCSLGVGFVSSRNAGKTWSKPARLSPRPMSLAWIAAAGGLRMVGDYISTSFVGTGGTAVGVFALAGPPDVVFHESMFAAIVRV